jgi:hypothetical protein
VRRPDRHKIQSAPEPPPCRVGLAAIPRPFFSAAVASLSESDRARYHRAQWPAPMTNFLFVGAGAAGLMTVYEWIHTRSRWENTVGGVISAPHASRQDLAVGASWTSLPPRVITALALCFGGVLRRSPCHKAGSQPGLPGWRFLGAEVSAASTRTSSSVSSADTVFQRAAP